MKKIRFGSWSTPYKDSEFLIDSEDEDGYYFKNNKGSECYVFKSDAPDFKYEIIEDNMITGKEALIALANGKEVQARAKNCTTWSNNIKYWLVNEILSCGGDFRIKPHTITFNGIEVPAPFEPKIGEEYWLITSAKECGYGFNIHREEWNRSGWMQFGAWRTEDEIKQVVAALRSIFATA